MLLKKSLLLAFLFVSLSVPLTSYAETVWIDVRSVIEHTFDHIDGDQRISHDEIVGEISAIYPDKDTEIALYCGSGGRAEKALTLLKEAGYKNLLNAGGIDDARTARGIAD